MEINFVEQSQPWKRSSTDSENEKLILRCKTQLEYHNYPHFQGTAPVTGTPAEVCQPRSPKHHNSRFPAAEGLLCLASCRSQGGLFFFSTPRNTAGELSSCCSEADGSQTAEPLLLIHQKPGNERHWVISGSSFPRES